MSVVASSIKVPHRDDQKLSANCREVHVIYVLLIINVCYLFYNMQYNKKSYNP